MTDRPRPTTTIRRAIGRRGGGPALLLAFLSVAIPAIAIAEDPQLEEIRAEMAALRNDYETRMAALEARLAALEAAAEPEAVPEETASDLESLRAAARQAAGELPPPAVPSSTGPAVGRERNLNRLNPEISFTGILLGSTSDRDREAFELEAFELDFQSALDPFSRTRVVLGVHEGEVEIEEAWVRYASLAGGLDLLAGKIRQRFGPLNRQHLHALPQSTRPLAHEAYFGEEGLAQTGLSLTWLLPRPWASANELTFEITNGENEAAFGGELFEDFSFLGRLKNFWELSDASFFEWGLSGVAGEDSTGGDSRVWGTDFTLNWQPPARSKYRDFTWRTELLLSQRQDVLGSDLEALGFYSYLEGLLRRNLYAGVRYDRVEDSLDPESVEWGLLPYLTWWQSEYVRVRGEYGYLKNRTTGDEENRFTLQLTWAAGPHKHETY